MSTLARLALFAVAILTGAPCAPARLGDTLEEAARRYGQHYAFHRHYGNATYHYVQHAEWRYEEDNAAIRVDFTEGGHAFCITYTTDGGFSHEGARALMRLNEPEGDPFEWQPTSNSHRIVYRTKTRTRYAVFYLSVTGEVMFVQVHTAPKPDRPLYDLIDRIERGERAIGLKEDKGPPKTRTPHSYAPFMEPHEHN